MKNKIKIFLLLTWLCFQSDLCYSMGWQLPTVDLSVTGQNAYNPQIAMDSTGNAIAIWYRSNGDNNIIQTKRYDDATSTWSTVTDLSVTGQDAYNPQVAMDSAGNAIAIWYRSDGSNDIIQTKRYVKATNTWSTVTNLSETTQNAYNPQVAMDSTGNAIAIWYRFNDSNNIIQTKRYDEATKTWSTVTNLSDPGQDAYNPQVAMDSTGNAIAIWYRSDGSNDIIQTKRYVEATDTWSTVTNLSVTGQDAYSPQVAMNSTGNAIAIWRSFNGSNNIIQAKKYIVDSVWETNATSLSVTGQDAYSPQIAMDSTGNAIAIWYRSDGSNNIIQAKKYIVDSVWETDATSLSATGKNASKPQIAMDGTRNATVIWYRKNDSSKRIVQAVLYKGQLPAPTNLTASKQIHRFPTQIDLIHSLAWDSVENATKYKIYLDIGSENFLATESTNPSTELHGRNPNTSYTYNVVSVDSHENNGLPTSVTI